MEKGDISPLGDIPMAIYFDFETTASTEYCFDFEQKMFVMSYVLIGAFHPNLILRKIIVQRCYGQTLQQLSTLDHLTRSLPRFFSRPTVDCQRKNLAEPFTATPFSVAPKFC